MSVPSPVEVLRVKDVASCREWLTRLPDDEQRLPSIERLIASLSRNRAAPDATLEIAEQARAAHLSAITALIGTLTAQPVPTPAPAWARLQAVLRSLELGRDLYKHLHTQLLDGSGLATRSVIPGAAESLRTVLPLARALDYEARRLSIALRLRVVLEPAAWRESCLLAEHLRRSTFVDATLPDPVPLIRAASARALFVYPILLQLAALPERGEHEIALVDRLAQRWAAKVGFRIDVDGRLHENHHGPTWSVQERVSVRLDTHRLMRRLEPRLQMLESGDEHGEVRLPRGMSREQARALLRQLCGCWSDAWRPVPLAAPPARRARLRFGVLPLRGVGLQGSASTGTVPIAQAGAASAAYVYGRFETNTIVRMALGAHNADRDPVGVLMGDASVAVWVGEQGGRSVFEIAWPTPVLAIGTLALMRAEPGEGGPAFAAGRIVAVQQAVATDGSGGRRLRVAIEFYRRDAELVGLRVDDQAFYEDAVLLPGEPPSVLLPIGRWRPDGPAMLREPDADVRIAFDRAVERGAGFERVRIRVLGR